MTTITTRTLRLTAAATTLATLVACSSGVPLDNAQGNTTIQSGTTSTAPAHSTVQSVDLNAQNNALAADGGPRDVARVVYFDFDSYAIRADAQPTVDAHAQFLKAQSASKVLIAGHTDERGGREYNLALGQKRAEAVRRSMTLLGAADAQIEAVSYGEEKPAASGNTEAAHAQNRRAEISYR